MGSIRLLDCTLRDGGHINQGQFGCKVIKNIIRNLVDSGTDIIEAGFLWENVTDSDTARFHTISELKRYLPENMMNSKISLMADNVDLSHLETNDGTVEYIRLSFRKSEFEWAKNTASILMDKGYKIFINPIHCSSFTDKEYLQIVDFVNQIHPYGFSIVDTFGALRQDDLGRIYYLIENNLDKDIVIGVHLHANLGLAYSLAQYILNIVEPTRNIIIDGSLYGMGKIPGNLCIEQLMDYLNNKYEAHYSIEPVYDLIDDYIMPIYKKTPWGYTIPYALSAQCSVHRSYAEFLQDKGRLRTKDIRRILSSIDGMHAEIFDEIYIENLYRMYLDIEIDDSDYLLRLKDKINKYNKIIILAPGASLKTFNIDEERNSCSCTISVNFVYEKKVDYYFFTNNKRLNDFLSSKIDFSHMIITSNLMKEVIESEYIFSRSDLIYHDGMPCDDSTIMLLNLLKRIGVKKVFLAGFDGFIRNTKNFYDLSYEHDVRNADYDIEYKKNILKNSYSYMEIVFLTPSLYDN